MTASESRYLYQIAVREHGGVSYTLVKDALQGAGLVPKPAVATGAAGSRAPASASSGTSIAVGTRG